MKLSQQISARSLNLAKRFLIKDGGCPPHIMFDANHFHIQTTFDIADSVEVLKHPS